MTEEPDSARRLRPKERKFYTDEGPDMEDLEARRKFCVEEKLFSTRYTANFVKELKGDEVTMAYFQEHGFTTPLMTKDKTGLGMRVPSENFKVSDVKQCVGSRRQLDVMDVNTQKGLEMSMKDWVRYYENPNRERLLNVISLEFSHTRLENYVEQPLVVRQLDWVDNAWPRFLKDSQTECTNIIEKMKYPKVQKYCLMSVKGCYTDFHIDMGGTSVWYHILHGRKTFWLVPPSERNLQLYEHWVLSGKQGDMFFGDKVDKCQRFDLDEGYTFFIPTGWIHAVYTSEDSLVFGGNFLHSLNIPMQLRIAEVEDKTKVPQKFRFPFFQELHWYLLDQYSRCLTGKSFRIKSEEELAAEAEERLKSGATDEGRATGDEALEENQMSDAAKTEEEREDSTTPPRYPVDDNSYTNSPRPGLSKSPAAPSPGASPRQSPVYKKGNEENTAPRSPKPARSESRSPRASDSPMPGGRFARSDSRDGKKPDQSPGRKSDGSDPPSKKRSDPDIKTYFNQSELIRPVSVKLENCLLAGDRAKFQLDPSMTGVGGSSSGSGLSGYTSLSGASSVTYAGVNVARPGWIHLTQWELKGLRVLVRALEELAPNKLSVPKDIPDHTALIREIKRILLDHATDDPEAAVTGEMILKWPARKNKKSRTLTYAPRGPKPGSKKAGGTPGAGPGKGREKDAAAIRRRRVRCKVCEACTRGDCRECHYCMDMKKYGGAGKMKQSCKSRQCMMPVLPTSAVCSICGKDDRIKTEGMVEPVTTLMECGICWDIIHPECIGAPNPDSIKDGSVNEDLPNSWECPKCSGEGRQGALKPRMFKTVLAKSRLECRLGSSSSETSSRTELEEERSPLSHDEHGDSAVRHEVGVALKHEEAPIKHEDSITKHEDTLSTPKKQLIGRLEPEEGSPKSTPNRGGRRLRDGQEGEASPARKKVRSGDDSQKGTPRNKASRGAIGRPPGRHTSRGRERRKGNLPYNSDTSDFSDFEEDIQSGSSSKESSPVRSQGPGRGGIHGEDDVSSIDGASVSSRKRKESSMPKTSAPLKVIKLVQQRYAVRPAPIPPAAKHVETVSGVSHALDHEIWLLVFKYLSPVDLCACLRVCRTWNRWCIDRRLWAFINLSRRRITRDVLVGVVRRQPTTLDLSWTNISRKQLEWLAARLPQLKHLSLSGNSWAALCALCSSSCPLLYSLNLMWVSGIRDACMKDLISPPTDHRPGVDDSVSRLHRCTSLELAGSDISDVTLMVMTQYMPRLSSLDLSYCTKITDAGISILAAQSATTRQNLISLDLTGCNQLTDACFENLKHFTNIQSVSLAACPEVTVSACHNFVSNMVPQRQLVVKHEKCMSINP